MQIHKILPVTCVLLALSVPAWAQNTRYDFDYRTTDQRVQVFDDGKVTRIQFPEGTPDPTIVAVEPKGEVLLKITKEAPHVVINGIYSRLVMRWGNRREVQAVYNGAGGQDAGSERSGSAASFGTLEPQVKYGSVAKPVVVAHSQMTQAAAVNPDPARSRAAVVEMPSTQATPVVAPEAVKAVAAAPVPVKVEVKEEPKAIELAKPQPAAKTWQVEVRDVTLSNTFTRWAEAAGQKVRWDAEKHVLVEAPDTLTGSFEDAVTAVLSSPGIADGAYPLVVCFYSNNPPLARITRKSESSKECK